MNDPSRQALDEMIASAEDLFSKTRNDHVSPSDRRVAFVRFDEARKRFALRCTVDLLDLPMEDEHG